MFMVLINLGAYVQAQDVGETFNVDGIEYRVTSLSPNTVTAVDYTGTATIVDIPETVQGYTVIVIGDNAFQGNSQFKLTSVTLPNSITTIGDRAFADNAFTEVAIPGSVTTIMVYAFWNNNPMTEVVIPGSVTTIGEGAFGSIEDLATVRVEATTPPSLGTDGFTNRDAIDLIVPHGTEQTYFDSGWNGFKTINGILQVGVKFTIEGIEYEITSLSPSNVTAVDYTGTATEVVIPDTVQGYTVTGIGDQAFYNNNLAEVTISDNVTSIGDFAFSTNQLTSLHLGEGVTTIGMAAFAVNELTEVTIPNSVTVIGDQAFHNSKLDRIDLGEGVISIAFGAFSTNPITLVVSRNENPPQQNAFDQDRGSIDMYVPVGKIETYKNNGWDGFKSYTEIGVTLSVNEAVFGNSLRITNPVTSVLTIMGPEGFELKAATLYSLLGNQVLHTTNTTVNTGSLPSGLYILKIENTAGQIATKKIIKQ